MRAVRVAWDAGFKSEAWHSGYVWLGWGVMGSLLPLWGTALLLVLFGREMSLYELLKNGEFVLYAASFIGGSMYTIRRDVFPSKNTLTMVLVGSLAVCSLVFAAIAVTTLEKQVSRSLEWLQLNPTALTWTSVAVFVIATLMCLVVMVVDSSGAAVDIPEKLKEQPDRLEAEFDRMQKEDKPE